MHLLFYSARQITVKSLPMVQILAYVLSWKYYLKQKENVALEYASVHRVFMRQGSKLVPAIFDANNF